MSNLKPMDIDGTAATNQVRVFGIGLDAGDDPVSLQLKRTAIQARENNGRIWMVAAPL